MFLNSGKRVTRRLGLLFPLKVVFLCQPNLNFVPVCWLLYHFGIYRLNQIL